jgi:hypothetical protein
MQTPHCPPWPPPRKAGPLQDAWQALQPPLSPHPAQPSRPGQTCVGSGVLTSGVGTMAYGAEPCLHMHCTPMHTLCCTPHFLIHLPPAKHAVHTTSLSIDHWCIANKCLLLFLAASVCTCVLCLLSASLVCCAPQKGQVVSTLNPSIPAATGQEVGKTSNPLPPVLFPGVLSRGTGCSCTHGLLQLSH